MKHISDTLPPSGTPQRLAELFRRGIRQAGRYTPEERARLEADWKAAEARTREAHARGQAEAWPEHLRRCGAPPEAVLALARVEPWAPGWALVQTPAVQSVREWLERGLRWLVLTGGTGAGKSLAACLALRHAQRTETRTPYGLAEWDADAGRFVRLGALFRLSDFEARDRAEWEHVKRCRVLVLDEVGGRPGDVPTPRQQEALDELVDARDRAGARTVLTSNLSLQRTDTGESDFARYVGRKNLSRMARSYLARDVGTRDLRREVAR